MTTSIEVKAFCRIHHVDLGNERIVLLHQGQCSYRRISHRRSNRYLIHPDDRPLNRNKLKRDERMMRVIILFDRTRTFNTVIIDDRYNV